MYTYYRCAVRSVEDVHEKTVRLRGSLMAFALITGHWSYIHTIRRPKMCGQVVEVKTQLTHRDYLNMLAQRDDSHFTIFKRRRCFLINNQYFQLDIYREPAHPRCKGLMLLETYTALPSDKLQNILPKFLTIEKEVTGNPDYSMFNLSLHEK